MGGCFQVDSSGNANSFIMADNGDRWRLAFQSSTESTVC